MKYFLHDSSSFEDEKISMLFIEHGYEGLGLFYTILEKLAKQERPINTRVLKMQLKVGKRLEKCWSFMEQINLISSKNGETSNERLRKFGESIDKKRENTSKRVSEYRDKQSVMNNVTRYDSEGNASNNTEHNYTTTKEEINKEDEGWIESTSSDSPDEFNDQEKTPPKVPPKGSPRFDPARVQLPFSSDEFIAAWFAWIRHRQEIKKPLTEMAVEQQLKKLASYTEDFAVALILQTIEKGWQGIVYELRTQSTMGRAAPGPEKGNIQKNYESALIAERRILEKRGLIPVE